MILHSDREGNDCIRKLRCHCIQIMHSDIYSVCKIRILKGLGVILLRSSKMLLTFEFWLNWIQVLKAKHCCGLSTNLLFSFQYKPGIKQNMVFSAAMLNVAKIRISSHYTTGSLQKSTKAFLNPLDFIHCTIIYFVYG